MFRRPKQAKKKSGKDGEKGYEKVSAKDAKPTENIGVSSGQDSKGDGTDGNGYEMVMKPK